jgi:hypothetical protein
MADTFWTALGTSLTAALVTALGIWTIRRFADWGQRNTAYFMCFAAGVLISATFLHMIPKAFSMNPQAPTWLLVGFVGLHVFNRFLTAFVCEKSPESKDYAIGVLPRAEQEQRRYSPVALAGGILVALVVVTSKH